MKRLLLTTLAAATTAAFAAVGLAEANGHGGHFLIGKQLQFTGATSVAGTFTIAGRFSDAGSEKGSFTASAGPHNTTNVVGNETLKGKHGTIKLHFTVVSSPASDAKHEFDIGKETVTAGTGPYAGIVGKQLGLEGVLNLTASTDVEIADSGTGG